MKSISFIPYVFSNLRKSGVHHFKRYAIWRWNEEVMAIWRRLCKQWAEMSQPHPISQLLDTFLKYFLELKLCIPYVVSKLGKLGVQHFKRCMIWIWNEEVMSVWRWTTQSQSGIFLISQPRPHFEGCFAAAKPPFGTRHYKKMYFSWQKFRGEF